LALLEARRVLKPSGKLVVGLYVDGGKLGRRTMMREAKEVIRAILTSAGFSRYKDHHTLHPTFANLQRLIRDNGFQIDDVFWQPQWNDQVCYITASQTASSEMSSVNRAKHAVCLANVYRVSSVARTGSKNQGSADIPEDTMDDRTVELK
jgi:hypothetical protein